MVKFNVAIESQPYILVELKIYTPLSVYSSPFHSYVSHAVIASEEEELVLIVRLIVAVESQP